MGDRATRVALVTPYYPPSVGGLERYTHTLALALRDDPAFDVVVITTNTESRRSVTSTEDGILVERLAPWFKVSNTPVNPWWTLQVPRLLRKHAIDVVHAHTPTPFLADIATITAGPRPVVMTSHSGSMAKGTGGAADALVWTYERWVQPRVFARADTVIGVSPVALAHRDGDVDLVPPGVDTNHFTPRRVASSLDVTYVGRVQRSSRWKGIQVLIDSFPQILAQVPSARLVLVGDGDDLPSVRSRAAELGIDEHVVWRGALSGDELVRAYQQSAIVVLPSLTESESFGMTLIEALACGVPVVGSDVGGIPYVIRDGVDGLLVPPGDVDGLAHALSALLTDAPRRTRMGVEGRAAAVSRWDWKHSTSKNLKILRDAGRAPRRA